MSITSIRQLELCIAQTVIPLPCFFPSVSSIKTNMMPVDYIELLNAASHPLYLISAFDIANSPREHQLRIDAVLNKSKERGTAILMDSGNYESFWKGDSTWIADKFHQIVRTSQHHLCFCYDNQEPPENADTIANDVIRSVTRDQEQALGTVIPIVHGATDQLAIATRNVAEQLCPIMLAVPERALGEGIAARIRTVRSIRRSLDELSFYCPLHLLGTGNPLSIIAYALAGADSFDGLEWCKTVVDHETGKLSHFQQWDLFCYQTDWGKNDCLPYIQTVLLHNLDFYQKFMVELHDAIKNSVTIEFLRKYASENQAKILLDAMKGGE